MLQTIPLLCLAMTGCLEFEAQTVRMEYDKDADRLVLHVVTHGIHWAGDDLDKGRSRFDRFVASNSACLLAWPFVFDPTGLEDEEHPLARSLLKSVQVRRLGFFLDDQGRLSGAQTIVITGASQLIAAVNEAISREAQSIPDAKPDKKDGPSAETVALIRAAARKGHRWARLRGHALELVAPVAESDFRRAKREFLKGLREAKDDDHGLLSYLISENTVSVMRDGDMVHLIFGNPGRPTTFRSRTGDGSGDNLTAHVRGKYGLDLDAKLAPLLLAPPARLDPKILKAHLADLDAASPERRARAARALAGAPGNVAELEAWAKTAGPEGRRQLKVILTGLQSRAALQDFAATLPLHARVRVLLGVKGDKADAALTRLRRTATGENKNPSDVRAYWQAWLKNRRTSRDE